jgi:hypothetical protein
VFTKQIKKIIPFDVLDYTVDVSKSKLQFAKNAANSLIFTTDGIVPSKAADQTTLIITKSFSKSEIEDKKLFCLNRLKQLTVELTTTEAPTEISIDGISGYEIMSLSKDKESDEEEKMCQIILFSDNLYYIFFGSTNQNFEDNIKEIRNVVETFKRK